MILFCNSCYAITEQGALQDGPFYLTSCFHIYCTTCTHQIRNNGCSVCSKLCQFVKIGKEMPPNLRGLFEPPLAKFEKLHQQFRFLRQQQAIAFKLKEQWEEAQKKKEHQIKMILDMEAKVKAEEQRWEKRIQCKLEDYKKVKLQYQKLDAQEKRLIKLFEENGFAVDEEDVSRVSADSGMFSFENSRRFDQ